MELDEFRDKQFAGAAALAEAVMTAMPGIDAHQEKGTVTTLPDERTVRYYMSEGLIPAATEKRGTSTLFGYIHLLALLTVKKLQAENLPIKKIREVIEGKSERELEILLGSADPTSRNEAQEYLESLLLSRPSQSFQMPAASAPPPSTDLNMPLFSAQSLSAEAAPNEPDRSTSSWSRYEVEPGVEMHVSSDFKAPQDESEIKKILGSIEQAIRSFIRK